MHSELTNVWLRFKFNSRKRGWLISNERTRRILIGKHLWSTFLELKLCALVIFLPLIPPIATKFLERCCYCFVRSSWKLLSERFFCDSRTGEEPCDTWNDSDAVSNERSLIHFDKYRVIKLQVGILCSMEYANIESLRFLRSMRKFNRGNLYTNIGLLVYKPPRHRITRLVISRYISS